MNSLSIDQYKRIIENFQLARKARRNKHGNIKMLNSDGTVSDSKKEARIDAQIMLLKNCPDVSSVKRKTVFRLSINGILICKYICDWEVCYKDGRREVYDAKGYKTPVYRIKKKLMEAIHGIHIIEV